MDCVLLNPIVKVRLFSKSYEDVFVMFSVLVPGLISRYVPMP